MDENSKKIKSMYIGQIINRIILILVFFVLIANVAATAYMGIQINRFTQMVEPAITALSELDVEELNNTLTTINDVVDVFKVDETLEELSKIDFQGFQDVISGIDVEKLNSTLTKIDEASKFLKKIGDGVNKMLSQFGININETE